MARPLVLWWLLPLLPPLSLPCVSRVLARLPEPDWDGMQDVSATSTTRASRALPAGRRDEDDLQGAIADPLARGRLPVRIGLTRGELRALIMMVANRLRKEGNMSTNRLSDWDVVVTNDAHSKNTVVYLLTLADRGGHGGCAVGGTASTTVATTTMTSTSAAGMVTTAGPSDAGRVIGNLCPPCPVASPEPATPNVTEDAGEAPTTVPNHPIAKTVGQIMTSLGLGLAQHHHESVPDLHAALSGLSALIEDYRRQVSSTPPPQATQGAERNKTRPAASPVPGQQQVPQETPQSHFPQQVAPQNPGQFHHGLRSLGGPDQMPMSQQQQLSQPHQYPTHAQLQQLAAAHYGPPPPQHSTDAQHSPQAGPMPQQHQPPPSQHAQHPHEVGTPQQNHAHHFQPIPSSTQQQALHHQQPPQAQQQPPPMPQHPPPLQSQQAQHLIQALQQLQPVQQPLQPQQPPQLPQQNQIAPSPPRTSQAAQAVPPYLHPALPAVVQYPPYQLPPYTYQNLPQSMALAQPVSLQVQMSPQLGQLPLSESLQPPQIQPAAIALRAAPAAQPQHPAPYRSPQSALDAAMQKIQSLSERLQLANLPVPGVGGGNGMQMDDLGISVDERMHASGGFTPDGLLPFNSVAEQTLGVADATAAALAASEHRQWYATPPDQRQRHDHDQARLRFARSAEDATASASGDGEAGGEEPGTYNGDEEVAELQRIVGGTNAKITDFPYQVALEFSGHMTCGGSILNPEWILTAAHCVERRTSRLGDWRIRAGSTLRETDGKVLKVRAISVHPLYHELKNDVALIKLANKITISDEARPVKLPDQGAPEPSPGSIMIITGWGKLISHSSSYPKTLQTARVKIIARPACTRAYAHTVYGPISEVELCAGGDNKDACQGDSGGPMVDTDGVQRGITSWGEGCANFPGVYTNIADPKVRDFIYKTTGV